MNKLYLLALITALVFGAYIYGTNVADARCKMRVAQENLKAIENNNIQNIKNKRIINESVYKTGAGDLRRILRDKYTIAE